jgi:type IV pilus assembly protein PilM
MSDQKRWDQKVKYPLFYKDKPVLGFDIGHSTIKVVQIGQGHGNRLRVLGYGYNTFNEHAIEDGVIVDMEALAACANPLITQLIIGRINTDRVAVAIPAARSFTRILTLPAKAASDLKQTVLLEAEQYVPLPVEDLYIDYQITKEIPAANEEEAQIEVVMVATPTKLIDSYMMLFDILGLEVALMETSLISNARVFVRGKPMDKPLLLIDFGSRSSDINIFDGALRVAGTVDGGGESLTDAIAKAFSVTTKQAYILKTRYGLKRGAKQHEIETAVAPILDSVVKEITKMMRYYKDREKKVTEFEGIVMSGGGANLPGLAEYMTARTKIAASVANPWSQLDFGRLQQPHSLESTIYTTAVGLAYATLEKHYD